MRIKYRIQEIKYEIYKKLWSWVVFKAFPTFDFSFFFDMMHLYFKQMSYDYDHYGHTVNTHRYAKKQLIVSEYAKYIAENKSFDNAFYGAPETKMWTEPIEIDGVEYGSLQFDNPESNTKFRKRWEKENYLEQFYKEEFFRLLNKHIYHWWD